MGCRLCRCDQDNPDVQRSIQVAKGFFHIKNKHLNKINSSEKKYKQYNSKIYKEKLIELIQDKRKKNVLTQKREQETYLDPFQKIAEGMKSQKYESLVLNMIAAKKKANDILLRKNVIEEQDQQSQELDELFQEMILQDFQQTIFKKEKRRRQDQTFLQNQLAGGNSMIAQQLGDRLSIHHQFSNNSQNINLDNNYNNNQNNSNNSNNIFKNSSNNNNQQSLNNMNVINSFNNFHSQDRGISQNSYTNNNIILLSPPSLQNSQQISIDRGVSLGRQPSIQQQQQSNFQSSSQVDQNMLYSMVDANKDYQMPTIQVQKYLLNYLYQRVSNNQHIVKSLIDEFGSLISEKFNPIFENNQNEIVHQDNELTQSKMDGFVQIQQCIENDIKFLINLIKDYLKSIYGENVLPERLFDSNQQNKIFDVFVRKIVFDNCSICHLANISMAIVSIKKQTQLFNFIIKVREQINIANAFINNPKLQFLSENYNDNPFQELDQNFFKIQNITSPQLKKVELSTLRNSLKTILKKLTQECNFQQELNTEEYWLIYYFILIQTELPIFQDIQFIKVYSNESNQEHDYLYTIFDEVYEEFITFSEQGDDGVVNFINQFFPQNDSNENKNNNNNNNKNNNNNEIEQNNHYQIKEEDESISISQMSRLSQNDFQFNQMNSQLKKQLQTSSLLNNINVQSNSSHTITEYYAGENSSNQSNNNHNNQQLIFSNSAILSTNREKDNNNNKNNYFVSSQEINNNTGRKEQSIDQKETNQSNYFNDFENQQMISTAAACSSFHINESQIE